MDHRSLEGLLAVVVVEAVDAQDHEPEHVLGVLTPLAERWRGTVRPGRRASWAVVVGSAPRAVALARAVQAACGESVRAGLHVGDTRERDGEVVGVAVTGARALAQRAAAGQVLVSRVVRDLVAGTDGVTFTEVRDGTGDLSDGELAHALVTATPTMPSVTRDTVGGAVERLHAAVAAARVVEVVAGAGAGKTTVARAVAERRPTVWLSVPATGLGPAALARALVDGLRMRVPGLPRALAELTGGLQADDEDGRGRAEALAASVAEAVAARVADGLLVVVDGVDHLAGSSTAATLLEALARNAPAGTCLLLLGRRDPGLRTGRLDVAGGVVRFSEADLRLSDDEVAALVAPRLGAVADAPRVRDMVRFADGNPEAAVLVAARARRGHDVDESRPAATLAQALVAEAGDEDAAVLEVLAALRTASPSLLQTVIGRPVGPVLDRLRIDGLVRLVGGATGDLELGAAANEAVTVDTDVRRRVCLAAARALDAEGDVARALRVLDAPDTVDARAELLRGSGRRLLASGDWPAVLEAVGPAGTDPDFPPGPAGVPVDHELAGLVGEAWRLAGDRHRALRWFSRATEGVDRVPAWSAWRTGILLHFGGELQRARAVYERAELDGDPTDVALVRAWHAAAAWVQGDVDRCRVEAEAAVALATGAGDDRAMAAAWTVRAMLAATDGDRGANDRHYLRALQHAERGGDLLQVVRIRSNRGSRLLEEGEHTAALAELEEALRTADLLGELPLHAMALSNRGQVLGRLGRLDEATADVAASRAIFERAGSRWVGYALCHLGDLHRLRGDRALALAAYREAVEQAEPVHDTQGLVPALTGLARLMRDRDPDRARELAERACAHPEALGHVEALAVLADVAMAQGDGPAAEQAVVVGLALARQRRDRPGLAQLLEQQARIVQDTDEAEALLREAQALWGRMVCPLEVARVDVALDVRTGTLEARAAAERAVRTLRSHGARALAEEAEATLASLRAEARAPVHVRLFGPLEVQRSGQDPTALDPPDPDVGDLLALRLLERSGVASRADAATVLWPDDPDSAGRLASASAGLAALLAPVVPPAEAEAAVLDPSLVTCDLDRLRAEAERGLAAVRSGEPGAEAHLLAAEATYRGDLLEDRPPVPWVVTARDDAAETWLQVVTALVELAEEQDDHHRAVRLLLRVLERDPHDEGAHLRLVGCLEVAGRRGESRRRYRAYTARMQEIGVEPAPFPQVAVTPRAPAG